MQALILAGGGGTRLRPLTNNRPKIIVPIGNQPFLARQIELLKTAGITDITLSLSCRFSAIEKSFGDGSDYGVDLKYLVEPRPLGTAGAYKYAEQFLNSPTIVLNGDILTDINLQDVIDHHNSIATIVLTKVKNPGAYGLVEVNDNSEVLNFLEKPEHNQINNLNTINAGIYILESKVLNLIPKDEKYSFEYQLFPSLLNTKRKFRAYIANDNYWLDIGTPERYLQAHYHLMDGKILNIQPQRCQSSELSGLAEVDGKSIIAKSCVIKAGAKITNSTLGENVIIEENSTISNSVIWAETKVGAETTICNSILGNNCQIGSKVSLKKGSYIGDSTTLTDSTIY